MKRKFRLTKIFSICLGTVLCKHVEIDGGTRTRDVKCRSVLDALGRISVFHGGEEGRKE